MHLGVIYKHVLKQVFLMFGIAVACYRFSLA
jgi:hypothetical protein